MQRTKKKTNFFWKNCLSCLTHTNVIRVLNTTIHSVEAMKIVSIFGLNTLLYPCKRTLVNMELHHF